MSSHSLSFPLAPEGAARFEASVFDDPAFAGGRVRAIRSHETWLDTRDGGLRACGLALSVVSAAGRHAMRPRHWPDHVDVDWTDAPIAGQSPDFTALPETYRDACPEAFSPGALASAFECALEGRERLLTCERTQVAVAIVHGSIAAGGKSIEVCEARLELHAGRQHEFLAVARSLFPFARLRLDFSSPAEKGFRLAAGVWGAPVGKIGASIHSQMNAAEAFTAVIESCLRQFSLNDAVVATADEVEAVHQIRVAIRRLRAALSLFAPILRGVEFERLKAEFKWLFASLGAARDLDVLREQVASSGKGLAAALDGRSLDALEERRRAAHIAAKRMLASPRVEALLFDTAAFIYAGEWRRSSERAQMRDRGLSVCEFASRRLGKRYREFQNMAKEFACLDSEGLHDLRISAKGLRYFFEFLEPLARGPKAHERFREGVDSLADVQDNLGQVHDIDTQCATLAAASQNDRAFLTTEWLWEMKSRRDDLLQRARRDTRRAARAKPFWEAI